MRLTMNRKAPTCARRWMFLMVLFLLAVGGHRAVAAATLESDHPGLAADNPVDRARRSGKPTLVEFGAAGCVPCDMMQPILDNLRKDFGDRLNVVFVHVGEEQVPGARYGIRSIPVQVFYDAGGAESLPPRGVLRPGGSPQTACPDGG
jgi:thiol-disulfide isomerase/thioredoxin